MNIRRRTWPQRLTLTAVGIAAMACFATATSLAAGQWVLSQRQLIVIAEQTIEPELDGPAGVIVPGGTTVPDNSTATTVPVVLAEPDAANFLITGADNGDCDSDSPVTDDRLGLGERSDTIMIWRANPETNQLAVLSLPRDLYVKLAGGGKSRINSAYKPGDPSSLIETIYYNFGISIDHYIQIDFCAFRRLVNAVGGVKVPFEFPTRDKRSGLNIVNTGCVNLDGDMALAYVRSRHYQYEDPAGSGNWISDPTSDFGRIARQQAFLRRVVAKVVNEGLYSPSVAAALIETNSQYLVTDTGLTVGKMLEFAGTLRTLDPASITSYVIESTGQVINDQAVQIPRIKGANMKAILAIFRGEATLAAAPDQVFEGTATTVAVQTTSDAPMPTVIAEENVTGVTPDEATACN